MYQRDLLAQAKKQTFIPDRISRIKHILFYKVLIIQGPYTSINKKTIQKLIIKVPAINTMIKSICPDASAFIFFQQIQFCFLHLPHLLFVDSLSISLGFRKILCFSMCLLLIFSKSNEKMSLLVCSSGSPMVVNVTGNNLP